MILGNSGPFLRIEQPSAIFDSNAAKGDVIYSSSDGHVELAQAHAEPQALAIGLAFAAVLSGQTGEYITSGPITNDAWNLTPGLVYYLSPTVPGGITDVYPDTLGQYVVIIGMALTPTQMNIDIHWEMLI